MTVRALFAAARSAIDTAIDSGTHADAHSALLACGHALDAARSRTGIREATRLAEKAQRILDAAPLW